jgi:glycosyltransferase involved in cell wall biosynthesis
VWCDQLLRGMPEHHFGVCAITGTGAEPLAWELPSHVSVERIPLWGPAPAGRAPRGKAAGRFADLYRELLGCLLHARPELVQDRFVAVLRDLFLLSGSHDVAAALRGEAAVRLLISAWESSPVPGVNPTVRDALAATDLLEHALRPLRAPARPGQVTHAVTNGLAVLTGLAAKWAHGTPLLVTEHGVYLRERYLNYGAAPYAWPVKALMLAFLRLLCGAGYLLADLVTPGNRYNQRWELRCGADASRLRTVYNGVDPGHFPPAGPEPDVPTLSWAGRVDPIKDVETLIRAFALVKAELPDARLRLFGGGDQAYRARCEQLIAELGLTGAAVFEGRVENIADAYAAGNVVMLSSISEGFPYTLIEAMTAGRATVSTDVGGVTEAVGDTGLVVPPRDPAAMAAASLELLADPARRARLGAAARDRALEYFTVEQAVTSFREIYASLSTSVPVGVGTASVPVGVA